MAWWGKLVGGTLGFLIGGPLGALLGAVLGHNLDVGLKVIRDKQIGHDDIDFAPGDQERVQMAFFTATFSVMGALAKADGLITHDEIALAESVMRQMNLPADMRQTAMRLFNEGKQSGFPLQGVILQFRQECHRRANLMRIFMEIQVQAAYADGQLHAKEEKLLIEICDWLGFHEAVFRQIEALVKFSLGISGKSRQHHQGYQQYSAEQDSQLTRAEAYELLGVTPSSSRDEIKKAYRRLMSQHHPDKLVAKGLPEEMMKLATEKSQKIREAYDLITGSH